MQQNVKSAKITFDKNTNSSKQRHIILYMYICLICLYMEQILRKQIDLKTANMQDDHVSFFSKKSLLLHVPFLQINDLFVGKIVVTVKPV